jgi:transglutaminase-like putative cysteine protease
MRLHASCEMTLTAKQPVPLVAMLRPRSGRGQWVASETYELEPFVPVVEYVDPFGNLCQRLLAPKGSFRIRVESVVETADDIDVAPGAPLTPVEELPDDALHFLLPSRYCPSDRTCDVAATVTHGKKLGYDQVEAIRAFIHEHIEYKYGVSDGSTSALETLKDRAGVCRDFAHVGISLCRALGMPSRMVVGYLHRLDPMDMHAWFETFVGGRWYTFDATQQQPRGGRIAVAYGRDAADVALFTEYGPIELKKMKVAVAAVSSGSAL